MKTISNKTHRPIRIPLAGGRVLHLGASKTGQISDNAAARPAVQKLLQSGDIQIVGEGAQAPGGAGNPGAPHEATHGHPQSTLVRPKGNR